MKVVEIFYSIEGEGKRAGEPCVFIRFAGCNLKCSYCDTPYAQDATQCNNDMSVAQIAKEVYKYKDKCTNVTLTGGEPLLQDLEELLFTLAYRGFHINIETNGSIKYQGRRFLDKVFLTKDYKSISSGENHKMLLENFSDVRDTDVVKCVVGSLEDLEDAYYFYKQLSYEYWWASPYWYFSPVYGKLEPKDIVEFLKQHPVNKGRVQLQLHKYIWNPEERGV